MKTLIIFILRISSKPMIQYDTCFIMLSLDNVAISIHIILNTKDNVDYYCEKYGFMNLRIIYRKKHVSDINCKCKKYLLKLDERALIIFLMVYSSNKLYL